MVDNYKTYNDFINIPGMLDAVKEACAYPGIDPDGSITADLISKKYRYNRIGWETDEEFLYYFTNNIETYKEQYYQQLKNKPGSGILISWLTQVYRERELKHKENGNRTVKHDGKDSTTRTPDLYQYDTTVISTNYDNLKDVREEEGSQNVQHTGGYKDEYVEGYHKEEYKPHVGRKTQNGGDRQAWSGDSQIQANLPMSESYDGTAIIEPTNDPDKDEYYEKAYQHMPALKWNTASAQAQNGHREYAKDGTHVTETYVYGESGQGDITEREGKETSPDVTHRTYDKDGENEKTTYDGRKTTDTRTGAVTVTSPHTHGSETTDKSYSDIHDDTDRQARDREIYKGRDTDSATLLTRANTYIRSSNAWIWFTQQLDPCFLTNLE